MQQVYDLVVIGGGPGGYVAAIRAAQLGLKTAVIEKESLLGGTCLRVGCIPSKALLESSALYEHAQHDLKDHGIQIEKATVDVGAMQKRKDTVVTVLGRGIAGLMKKNKIDHVVGLGYFLGRDAAGVIRVGVKANAGNASGNGNTNGVAAGSADQELLAHRVIIATGSKVAPLRGVTVDRDRIGTSTEALAYSSVPKHLVVVGAGAIGLELGSVWRRLGAQVTVLEYLDRILPGMDAELATAALKVLKQQGLNFQLGVKVTGATVKGDQVTVEIDGKDPVVCDRVLVAVGRAPNTDGLALAAVGLAVDERGRIGVGDHFNTSAEGVYAIGDVIAGPMLAHKAEEEGVACVEHMVTGHSHVNYDTVALIVYTDPEIASVGKSEEQLKDAGIPYRKGSFPFMGNGRAKAMGATVGFVKVLAHAETDRILGVHIIGKHAGDLIAEAVTAMAFAASSEDLARVCHAHPTMWEAIKEAALAVDSRALHG